MTRGKSTQDLFDMLAEEEGLPLPESTIKPMHQPPRSTKTKTGLNPPERELVEHDPQLLLCKKIVDSAGSYKAEKSWPVDDFVQNNVPDVPNVTTIETETPKRDQNDLADITLGDLIDAQAEHDAEQEIMLIKAQQIFDDALSQCQENPGILGNPEFIAAWSVLKQDPSKAFECRAKLKKAKPPGILMSDLDNLTAGTIAREVGGQESVASELIDLALASGSLFHDPDSGRGFIGIEEDGVAMTFCIGTKDFSEWLGFSYYTNTKSDGRRGASASESAIKQACITLSGIARHEGEAQSVHLRVADHGGGHYLFLGDDQWRIIEILPTGWRILDQSPVRFWKPGAMQPLPTPEPGGDISKLWVFVNVPEESRLLVLAWILECWRESTPFPVLALSGLQGCAKSSTQSRLRELIDNSAVNLRAAPKCVEDVYVSAGCNWLASFENISHLSPNLQDALCTLATGGGFSARTLYTNNEKTIIKVKRPTVINSIPNVVTAQDLTDRAICIELPRIDYREEADISAEWEKAKGAIMGGLLDLFVATLDKLPTVKLDRPPRMADFTRLGEAMCISLGHPAGTFAALYHANRANSTAVALEASPVGVAVRELVDNASGLGDLVFYGTVKQLYDKLSADFRHNTEGWPRSPKGLSEAIKRQSPALNALGIDIHQGNKPERINGAQGVPIKITKSVNIGNIGNVVLKKTVSEKSFSDDTERF